MRITKDVIGYEKLYSIDNSGNVYSKRTHGLSFKYKEVI